MKLSIIILSLNEGRNLFYLFEEISKELDGKEFEIVIVEDGIDVDCLNVLSELKNYKNINVLQRALPNGLAGATENGFSKAQGDIFVVLDGDGTHDPININELVARASNYSIAVASRYTGKWSIDNSFQYHASRMFNSFVRKYLKTGVNDNLGGYYALTKQVANALLKENVFIGHGDYFLRVIFAAKKLGVEITEIPSVFRTRYSGAPTKSRFWMVRKYLVTTLELKSNLVN